MGWWCVLSQPLAPTRCETTRISTLLGWRLFPHFNICVTFAFFFGSLTFVSKPFHASCSYGLMSVSIQSMEMSPVKFSQTATKHRPVAVSFFLIEHQMVDASRLANAGILSSPAVLPRFGLLRCHHIPATWYTF